MKKMILSALSVLVCGAAFAAEKFQVNARVDLVSDYIWRGAYQNSGFSVQPSIGCGYAGFSLSAWGSQSLTKIDGAQEFDINLSYKVAGLTLTVSDYWWNGVAMPYGDYRHDHHFEGTVSYCFGEKVPLTLGWSTMFAGGDPAPDGGRAFSTYVMAGYDIQCPAGIVVTPSVGFTPWKGMYSQEGAAVTDISVKASREFAIGRHFRLPVFVQGIVSPVNDKAYLVAGAGFAF